MGRSTAENSEPEIIRHYSALDRCCKLFWMRSRRWVSIRIILPPTISHRSTSSIPEAVWPPSNSPTKWGSYPACIFWISARVSVGPSRYFAGHRGCFVTGIDLSGEFCEYGGRAFRSARSQRSYRVPAGERSSRAFRRCDVRRCSTACMSDEYGRRKRTCSAKTRSRPEAGAVSGIFDVMRGKPRAISALPGPVGDDK